MSLARMTVLLACLVLSISVRAGAQGETKPKFLQSSTRSAEIARQPDAKEGERLMADIANGSIDCTVDPSATTARISATFTVDGKDPADADRRAKLVKLYAERASDGTIIVDALFPGQKLPFDSVSVSIVLPTTEELVLKSASGSVRTKATMGRLRASTRSGSLSIDGHGGPIEARSAEGRIEIVGARENVQATSTNGAIAVGIADGNDQPFQIESRNGPVRVEVGPSFDGSIDMTTTTGAISIVDPAKHARVSEHSKARVTADLGAAAGQSGVKTTGGSITLTLRQK